MNGVMQGLNRGLNTLSGQPSSSFKFRLSACLWIWGLRELHVAMAASAPQQKAQKNHLAGEAPRHGAGRHPSIELPANQPVNEEMSRGHPAIVELSAACAG